ncbi:iron ABC transporter permease [Polynucleobacter sp. HIN11]|nr:iron ABC transporter permease [Polynucleobacter sp. HIN11]
MNFGAVDIQSADWLHLFSQQNGYEGPSYVLWTIRIPRVLLAITVGAALGIAGALAQSLFRNPLAEPGLLGVSAGASCSVAIGIVMLDGYRFIPTEELRIWVIPFFAFLGAIAVCFCLDYVARVVSPGSIAGLLLTGIALNALAGAVIGLCTYLANDEQLRSFTFWTLGSLASARWMMIGVLVGALFIGWIWIRTLLQDLNGLTLGENIANHLGINVSLLRTKVIVLVATLSGLAVAWCGMIGFIGLMAPNLVRICLGSDQKRVVPYSAGVGAILLLIADTIARTVAIPVEVPVGIFTALLGGPLFLLLLRQYRSRLD